MGRVQLKIVARTCIRAAPGLLFLLAPSAIPPAFAQAPVAIVEDVASNGAGVEIMDYLDVGRTIDLGPNGSLVLSYMNSCARETIHGGVVVVGRDQSEVRSGRIERVKVGCDAAEMMTAPGRNVDVAGMVMREGGASEEKVRGINPAQAPEFVLYGSSPLIDLHGEGPLVIARLDTQGEYLKMPIDAAQLVHGRFLDFAELGKTLTAGGVYGARWNKRLVVFRIDAKARPGKTPIIGRLLRLGWSQ